MVPKCYATGSTLAVVLVLQALPTPLLECAFWILTVWERWGRSCQDPQMPLRVPQRAQGEEETQNLHSLMLTFPCWGKNVSWEHMELSLQEGHTRMCLCIAQTHRHTHGHTHTHHPITWKEAEQR